MSGLAGSIAALDRHDGRRLALLTAIAVYALWGSPTPDRFGLPEMMIGLLLVLAIGPAGAMRAFHPAGGMAWEKTARLLLFYALSVPVFTGLLNGNGAAAMIRDILPFLFICLPLFLAPLYRGRTGDVKILTAAVALLGVIFALRVLLGGRALPLAPDTLLLANAPPVLFAALLCAGLAGFFLYKSVSLEASVKAVLLAGLALAPLTAMALVMQRASFGYLALAGTLLLLTAFVHRPLRTLWPVLIITAGTAILWPVITDIWQMLYQKTADVGLNMRIQEAQVVFDTVSATPFSLLFGRGWGATIVSPAVGGDIVNFTHSLLTMYWLKTGLIGMFMAVLYIIQLAIGLYPLLFRAPVLALALTGPLLINLFLYASFKSFDFGLLLLLIALWGTGHTQAAVIRSRRRRQLEKPAAL